MEESYKKKKKKYNHWKGKRKRNLKVETWRNMLQKYCGKWAVLAVSCALWHLKHISLLLQKHPDSVSHRFQRQYIHSIPRCPKQMRSSFSKLRHAKQHIAHILTQPKARTAFFWFLNCQECQKLCVFNLNVLLMQNRNYRKTLGETHFLPLPLQGWISFAAGRGWASTNVLTASLLPVFLSWKANAEIWLVDIWPSIVHQHLQTQTRLVDRRVWLKSSHIVFFSHLHSCGGGRQEARFQFKTNLCGRDDVILKWNGSQHTIKRLINNSRYYLCSFTCRSAAPIVNDCPYI